MTAREQHIEKIKETKLELMKPISKRRRHDLNKHLARLRKELKAYDSYTQKVCSK